MKRYHTLLAGASWMAEYGDPDTDDWENFLYKYSPYHSKQTTPSLDMLTLTIFIQISILMHLIRQFL